MKLTLTVVFVCLALGAATKADEQLERRLRETIEASLKKLFEAKLDAALSHQLELKDQLQTLELQHQQQNLQLRQELKEELREELREDLVGGWEQQCGCSAPQHVDMLSKVSTDLQMRLSDTEQLLSRVQQQLSGLVDGRLEDMEVQLVEQQRTTNELSTKLSEQQAAGLGHSFLVQLSSELVAARVRVRFDLVHYDRGYNYDQENGEYTVPEDGVYRFDAVVYVDDDAGFVELYLRVNSFSVAATTSTDAAKDDFYSTLYLTGQLQLRKGERVSVYAQYMTKVYGDREDLMRSYFSGHRVDY